MKIRTINPGQAWFPHEPVQFLPGLNIIRGQNGIGKTTILEYASLLGHVCVMSEGKLKTTPISLTVSLSPSDLRFLGMLESPPEEFKLAMAYFERALDAHQLRLEELKRLAKDAPIGPFNLNFEIDFMGEERDIKSVLIDEDLIKERVTVHCDDSGHLRIVRALNLWSRPHRTSTGQRTSWSITPRFIQACDLTFRSPDHVFPPDAAGCVGAPPVFYFNTDMYEFGVGLDIRESPKHLRSHLTDVLVDRIQVFHSFIPVQEKAVKSDLWECYPIGPQYTLLCQKQLADAWGDRIFPGQDAPPVSFERNEAPPAEVGDRTPPFRLALGEGEKTEFVSSGQNQAYFLLTMMYGLVSDGSCMLLDEPELHLSFAAGTEIVSEIYTRAMNTESQAIIVTHLPHLHQEKIRADDGEDAWIAAWRAEDSRTTRCLASAGSVSDEDGEQAGYNYKYVRMIFFGTKPNDMRVVPVYDLQAMRMAASSSHAEVKKLVDGLKLPDRVKIHPTLRELGQTVAQLTGAPAGRET